MTASARSPKYRSNIRISAVVLPLALIILTHCSGLLTKRHLYSFSGTTMGTVYTIKIVGNGNGQRRIQEEMKEIEADVTTLLTDINRKMSTYIEDSEISAFNRYKGVDWMTVSEETALVVKESIVISRLSAGAFDITVGPLVNLWGFGSGRVEHNVPDRETIDQVKQKVGYHYLDVRLQPPQIKKEIPDLYCDLSAIAKGYGVDRVSQYLDGLKIENYLVEIGGEIRVKGENHNGRPWNIGISRPVAAPKIQTILALTNNSMATSGDYRNYFEKDGVRFSHMIDPVLGRPITHKLASVTVIHSSCMRADAFATAINVLGPEKGYELAVQEKLPIFLIIRDGKDGFSVKMTPEFKKILAD